jgi:hypothetical protein
MSRSPCSAEAAPGVLFVVTFTGSDLDDTLDRMQGIRNDAAEVEVAPWRRREQLRDCPQPVVERADHRESPAIDILQG